MSNQMKIAELRELGGLVNLKAKNSFREVTEAAVLAREAGKAARKTSDADQTEGENDSKAVKRKTPAAKSPTEYDEQVELFAWADRSLSAYPELEMLFATINGAKMPYGKNRNGQRFSKEAMRQKKAGLKNGVPDLVLPVARCDYHGLFIELKRAKKSLSVVSVEQKEWIEKLTARGYLATVCYGAEEAKRVLMHYLEKNW